MNASYLTASSPEPFTILGKRLLPLSIGRLLLLNRYDCYPPASPSDLITAVIICSRACDKAEPALNDPFLEAKCWLWKKRLGKIDWDSALEFFGQYILANSRRPGLYEASGHDVLPGAPWLQHLRVLLRARCGWSVKEIAEESYSQALWDYYTYWEIENRVLIQPDEGQTGSALSAKEVAELSADADANHAERIAKANLIGGLHGL